MPSPQQDSRQSRRDLLKKAALGGGVAAAVWATPSVTRIGAVAAAAQTGVPCDTGVELVQNGDASTGTTAGWTGNLLIVNVGNPPPAFGAGGSNSYYTSSQTIELGLCDGTTARLSAYLRGEHTRQPSQVVVTWHAGTAGTGAVLGTLTISWTPTSFANQNTTGPVPAGTQSAVVTMRAHGHPSQTRGAIDNVSLRLT